jgi:hypothetical protein
LNHKNFYIFIIVFIYIHRYWKGEHMLFKGKKREAEQPVNRTLKVYSPAEVVEAGGPDKFAKKIGHESASEEISKTDQIPEEEWPEIEKMLERD